MSVKKQITEQEGVYSFISLPDGRAVKTGAGWNYEYFLKDHLGNNRVVFGYENIVDSYTATMETSTATTEEAQFKNVLATRVTNATLNHTPVSYLNTAPDKTAETNGYINKPIGPAKLLQVPLPSGVSRLGDSACRCE